MGARFALTLVATALLVAAFATTASAQQVSPGGPDAQVSEYVLPGTDIGPIQGEGNPSLGGPGPTGDVGSSGELAFTGLWLLPLAALGITLVVAGTAFRRRRATGAPAAV